MQKLESETLIILASDEGAELCSIKSASTGHEYLWQADPLFWKRHSPVLFPIVGGLWNGVYRHGDKQYSLNQHGFARDNKFELIEQQPTMVRYRFVDNEQTHKVYPFNFLLEIGYRLIENKIKVEWTVKNTGNEVLPFQIGAHPAFYYPDYSKESDNRGYFAFDKTDNIELNLISEKGCYSPTKHLLELTEGLLPLNVQSFDHDALIIENSQLHKVTLLNNLKRPVITLSFDAPVVGLWSPPHKNAPFVCIEPWYGRCDEAHFEGEFLEKQWMQQLEIGGEFNGGYEIEIHV